MLPPANTSTRGKVTSFLRQRLFQ